MNLRYKIGLVIGILLFVFGLGRCGRGKPTVPNVLPPNDKEQIIVDPVKHTLIIVRPGGNETVTLPDRPSVIDIRKDGSVSVTSKQFGFEHRFFLGLDGSDAIRGMAGMDFGYWKKLDLGVGVMGQFGNYTPRVFAMVSYNVYSNCRVGVTIDNTQHVGIGLTVRL
jgi:hypothetical protein